MYAKRLIINLMLCGDFENSKLIRREMLFKLYKAYIYLIFIIAPLSGTCVERAMRISLKHYIEECLEITRLPIPLFFQKPTLLRCVKSAFRIFSYCTVIVI